MEKSRRDSTLIEIINKTPITRDRYVDFLRAFSIIVVCIGHWLSAVVIKNETGIRVYNAVGMIRGMWLSTWILQVMPLFFFVGGFSNSRNINSLKNKGKGLKEFYKKRAIRLLKPTIFFCIIWFFIIIFLLIFLPDWQRYKMGLVATIGPLWFLGVYLFVTLVAPFMLKLHKSSKFLIISLLFISAVIIDLIRFKFKIYWVGWFNVFTVWLFVHQLGFFYEDDTLINIPVMKKFLIAFLGILGLIFLTNFGPYPKSMVGTGFEKISNMNPPTICIVMLSLWLVGLAMILRDVINKWLENANFWLLVILANRWIMTIYLWHLTAYAISYILLYQIGFGHHITDNITIWWLERPLWIAVPGIFLIIFIKIFGRFETSGMKGGGG
uniref:Acyltransferase n=1 Tax=candidate division WOR-3 bacterium TaxID=2052148 RepID=A0A7V3RFW5_UNCW3